MKKIKWNEKFVWIIKREGKNTWKERKLSEKYVWKEELKENMYKKNQGEKYVWRKE